MKIIFTFVQLTLFAQVTSAQPKLSKLIRQDLNGLGEWGNYEKTEYSYDEKGNETLSSYARYDNDNKRWENESREINEYNEHNQIIHTDAQQFTSEGTWQTYATYDYKYNQDGCETEKILWVYLNDVVDKYQNTYHTYSEGCLADTVTNIERRINKIDGTLEYYRKKVLSHRYSNGGKKINTDYYIEHDLGQNNFMKNAKVSEYDDNRNILVSIDSTSIAAPRKIVYSYYPDGELKTFDFYKWYAGQWVWINGRNHEIVFDEHFNPIEKNILWIDTFSLFPVSLRRSFYEYYCDHLVRTSRDATSKFIYQYTEPAECFDLSEEGIDALVFPNPATNVINIYSTALQSGDLTVSIYDTKGSLYYREEMKGREETKQIDISDLTNGMYLVNLTGKGDTITVKLLVNH